jgi:hypothetical protein
MSLHETTFDDITFECHFFMACGMIYYSCMCYFVNPWVTCCNQKKKSPRSHSALTACTTPSALVFPDLLHQVHTSESHNTRLAPDSHRCPCKTRDTQMFCFHITTAQNSHKYQPRRFFHYKLYTLPESTSMIPIKMLTNQQTSSSVYSLSLSLSSFYSSSASR